VKNSRKDKGKIRNAVPRWICRTCGKAHNKRLEARYCCVFIRSEDDEGL
jgi:transposase-like protein